MTATSHFKISTSFVLSGLIHLGLIAFLSLSTFSVKKAVDMVEVAIYESHVMSETPAPQMAQRPVAVAPVPNLGAQDESTKVPEQIAQERVTTSPPKNAIANDAQNAPEINNNQLEQTTSATQSAAEQDRYAQDVASELNRHKVYPEMALRLRHQGQVKVRFRIERTGRVLSAEIIEPAKYDSLNVAAQRLIQNIQNFKPFPAEVKEATWLFTVPIEYTL